MERWLVAAVVLTTVLPPAAAAAGTSVSSKSATKTLPRLLVLDFKASGGVNPDIVNIVQNLLVTHLQHIGKYQVVSQSDVVAMLGVDEQKQLVGCDASSCMAEVGGALGAAWLVTGKVDVLGKQQMLSLKLLNVHGARVEHQLSESLPADQKAIPEAMRQAAYRLLQLEVPPAKAPWYERWWVWTAAGVVVAGASVGGYFLLRPQPLPSSNLGVLRF